MTKRLQYGSDKDEIIEKGHDLARIHLPYSHGMKTLTQNTLRTERNQAAGGPPTWTKPFSKVCEDTFSNRQADPFVQPYAGQAYSSLAIAEELKTGHATKSYLSSSASLRGKREIGRRSQAILVY